MQLVLSLISFVSIAFPWYHGKGLFNDHIVRGCIQSINNWPEVWNVLT